MGEEEDAGMVYCKIQERDNSVESQMHLTIVKIIYPGHCGYSFETGGTMSNLRESTSNSKVSAYYNKFYRPENLKVIITEQISPEDLFRTLEPLEQQIVSKEFSRL